MTKTPNLKKKKSNSLPKYKQFLGKYTNIIKCFLYLGNKLDIFEKS